MNLSKVISGVALTVTAVAAGVGVYYSYQEYKTQRERTKTAQRGFDEDRRAAQKKYEQDLAAHEVELTRIDELRAADLAYHQKVMEELAEYDLRQQCRNKERDELITKFENNEISAEELNIGLQANMKAGLEDIGSITELRKQSPK